jgi:hypothetical protein
MGWEDFNLSLMGSINFSIDAHELILNVFDTASDALDKEWNTYVETMHKAFPTKVGENDTDAAYLSQEMYWMEDLHRQRRQGLGALALDWLTYSLQGALNGAKRYLDSTHPADGEYKSRDGWLGSISREFQERFNVDFNKAPVPFKRIQELVLARNASIHRTDGGLQQYLTKIDKPAFVDEEDRLFVGREALAAIIDDCQAFIGWVEHEVEQLRRAKSNKTESEIPRS